MAIGPGKYDDLCTIIREKASAYAAAVIIFGGDHGAGFAVQAPADFLPKLPEILRQMAIEIEADLATKKLGETN